MKWHEDQVYEDPHDPTPWQSNETLHEFVRRMTKAATEAYLTLANGMHKSMQGFRLLGFVEDEADPGLPRTNMEKLKALVEDKKLGHSMTPSQGYPRGRKHY